MSNEFGKGDSSYRAIGGEVGIARLVDAFYTVMEHDSRFLTIWRTISGVTWMRSQAGTRSVTW